MFPSQVTQWLATYGYGAVLLFVTIESTGIPFPGETMLLVAAMAAAASGAILGDNVGFWIGREGGFRLLRSSGHYIRLDERKLKLGLYLFRRHGGKVVFFGRFIAVLRAWTAFLAGTNQMRWSRFLWCNASGAIVWASLVGLGAYALGDTIRQLTGPVGISTAVLAGLMSVTFLLFVHQQQRRLEEEAGRAFPGPLDTYRARRGDGRSPHPLVGPTPRRTAELILVVARVLVGTQHCFSSFYSEKRRSLFMNKQTLFWGGILLFLVGVAAGIFFLIPGIPHIIADSNMHVKHAIAAFAVGVLGILAALVNRPRSRA